MTWILFLISDPFAVKRNVARTVNSQQMYEFILHCLKTTFKYFALPLNMQTNSKSQQGPFKGANAKTLNKDFSQLGIRSQNARHPDADENGPEDSDCIIEEEEVEEYSGSDEEREKEKVDMGKSSLSEDEEEVDVDIDARNRQHLDSVTTEDEEIFPVDEISGEEILSDEEGPDLDTAGSVDEEEVELVPVGVSPPFLEDTTKDETTENTNQKQSILSYQFTKQVFTRGKVSLAFEPEHVGTDNLRYIT